MFKAIRSQLLMVFRADAVIPSDADNAGLSSLAPSSISKQELNVVTGGICLDSRYGAISDWL